MTVLVVNWMANEGRENEVAEIFKKLAEASRLEPGCRMYIVHQHRDIARHFLIYEQYANDAALQAHRESEHFQRYAAKELPILGERLDGNLFREVV
jgi:(4S)-4-hydroxy-5-phosphonooxypentane-2,3-dione isomerase